MAQFLEAQNLALQNVKATEEKEIIDLEDALNRVVAQDIICIKDLPTYDNSAMDGYAFKYSERNRDLKVVATIMAGDIREPILKEGECYKIMTGAKVPSDVDTIAQREICEESNGIMHLTSDVKQGNAIRLKGEEQNKGSVLIEKGEILTGAKIALLATQGITKVEVYKKLSIAIVSTGNELKEPHEVASEDEVYNINAINIKMLLKNYSLDAEYLGSIPDDLEQGVEFISKLKECDLIITTGGISKGDADFTKQAFVQNGLKELFHGIKVKPGHPTMMGTMGSSFVMAMPGNPLAAIVNIILLSMPIIFKMQGVKNFYYESITVKNGKELKLKPGRVNIVLGILVDGKFIAYKNNKYGSGMITPLVESSYIAIFGEEVNLVSYDEDIFVVKINSQANSCKCKYIN